MIDRSAVDMPWSSAMGFPYRGAPRYCRRPDCPPRACKDERRLDPESNAGALSADRIHTRLTPEGIWSGLLRRSQQRLKHGFERRKVLGTSHDVLDLDGSVGKTLAD